MCTLTFIPRDDGYYVAMNRDERITRAEAAPPMLTKVGTTSAVFPRDAAGGTWAGANDCGIAFALLNQKDLGDPGEKTRSRGEIIPALLSHTSLREVQAAAQRFELSGMWPFRLIGVLPAEKRVGEWLWDQRRLAFQLHDWKPRHWFSSSLSDEQASRRRGAVCHGAWSEKDAGSLRWLRRLHGSHANGPFSICVHRGNVSTLSYTELVCTTKSVSCRYFSGSPCAMREIDRPIVTRRLSPQARRISV